MKAKPLECKGCPGAKRHRGFCPDEWNPNAKVAVLAEAPGAREVQDHSGPQGYGRPLVGPSGWLLESVLRNCGKTRKDICLSNVLRCHPPANFYPTGDARREMEARCRQWDTVIEKFDPTVVGVTWHPAFALPGKTPQVRLFIERALESAFELAKIGERPILCLGSKAFELLVPELDGNIKKWQRGWFRL